MPNGVDTIGLYILLIFSGVRSGSKKCNEPVQTICRQVQFIKFV